MNVGKLRKLKPFFRPQGGTVTAGNASPISDGAAAVVLASGRAVQRYGLPVVGRILGFGDAATDPRDFPTAPTLAIPKALEHAGAQGSGQQAGGAAQGRRCRRPHPSLGLPFPHGNIPMGPIPCTLQALHPPKWTIGR